MKTLRLLRALPTIIRLVLAARRAGCKSSKEGLAWAIEHGYVVNDGPGRARIYPPPRKPQA
jgi:hypothetical protein